MSIHVYRSAMNLLMALGTVYWVLVLREVIFEKQAVVSADLQFIGFILLFIGAVMIWDGIFNRGGKRDSPISASEIVYWVINSVFFFVILLVGVG